MEKCICGWWLARSKGRNHEASKTVKVTSDTVIDASAISEAMEEVVIWSDPDPLP